MFNVSMYFFPHVNAAPVVRYGPLCLHLFLTGLGGGGEQFRVDPSSVKSGSDGISAKILPGDGGTMPLSLTVRLFSNGVCRLKIDEAPPAKQRWEVRIYLNLSFIINK